MSSALHICDKRMKRATEQALKNDEHGRRGTAAEKPGAQSRKVLDACLHWQPAPLALRLDQTAPPR